MHIPNGSSSISSRYICPPDGTSKDNDEMMLVIPAMEQCRLSTSVSDSDSLKQDTTIQNEEQDKTSGKRPGN